MRAILDVNVLIAALLSRAGTPAGLLMAWAQGQFELLVSPLLLAELERALAYPKLRRHVMADDAAAYVDWLRRSATLVADPPGPPPAPSADPGDDYLLALASTQHAVLVTGDAGLRATAGGLPVLTPAEFTALLTGREA